MYVLFGDQPERETEMLLVDGSNVNLGEKKRLSENRDGLKRDGWKRDGYKRDGWKRTLL